MCFYVKVQVDLISGNLWRVLKSEGLRLVLL